MGTKTEIQWTDHTFNSIPGGAAWKSRQVATTATHASWHIVSDARCGVRLTPLAA
jgi:hypothetical protein